MTVAKEVEVSKENEDAEKQQRKPKKDSKERKPREDKKLQKVYKPKSKQDEAGPTDNTATHQTESTVEKVVEEPV